MKTSTSSYTRVDRSARNCHDGAVARRRETLAVLKAIEARLTEDFDKERLGWAELASLDHAHEELAELLAFLGDESALTARGGSW